MIALASLLAAVVAGACVVAALAVPVALEELCIRRVLVLRSSCSALIAHMEDVLSDSTVVGGLVRAGYHDDVVHALTLAHAACNAQDLVIEKLPRVRRDDLVEASARVESAWEDWTKLYDEVFVLGRVPGRWEDGAAY